MVRKTANCYYTVLWICNICNLWSSWKCRNIKTYYISYWKHNTIYAWILLPEDGTWMPKHGGVNVYHKRLISAHLSDDVCIVRTCSVWIHKICLNVVLILITAVIRRTHIWIFSNENCVIFFAFDSVMNNSGLKNKILGHSKHTLSF